MGPEEIGPNGTEIEDRSAETVIENDHYENIAETSEVLESNPVNSGNECLEKMVNNLMIALKDVRIDGEKFVEVVAGTLSGPVLIATLIENIPEMQQVSSTTAAEFAGPLIGLGVVASGIGLFRTYEIVRDFAKSYKFTKDRYERTGFKRFSVGSEN